MDSFKKINYCNQFYNVTLVQTIDKETGMEDKFLVYWEWFEGTGG